MAKDNKTADATFQSGFNLRDYLAACASKWIWFLVSIIVICGFAYYKVIRKMPVYLRTEQVLIKDEDQGNSIDNMASSFSGFGLGRMRSNVYNEIITFKSPALLTQVALKLNLQTDVTLLAFPHGASLFQSSQPYLYQFLDLGAEDYGSFRMTVSPEGSVSLDKFVSVDAAGKPVKHKNKVPLRLGATVRTPIGRVVVTPNPEFTAQLPKEETEYLVSHNGLHGTVEDLQTNLGVDLADRDADVVEITFKDTNVPRAEAILSTMVEIYNQDWIEDKNKVAAATNEFIDERLVAIETELGGVDDNILSYKSRIRVPDFEEAAKLQMGSSAELDNQILMAVNQMQVAQYLKEYVMNPANSNAVIPVNTGTTSNQLEVQIAEYNKMLLARNNVEAATSANNPLVQDYDTQLKGLRESVIRAINAQVEATRRAVANMEAEKGKVSANLAQGPQQAKALLSVERQQKVKEELYLYLLQKREENELSRKFTADNTRVITPPYGSNRPVEPKKKIVLAIAFLLSILLPAGIIFVREAMDNKVRSRHDLDDMSAPFAGEIPFVGRKKRFEWLTKRLNRNKKKKKLEKLPVIVQAGNRDIINESFRIVRSNIDFMMKNADTSNVIMMTSFNPGSGKSFITFNIGASFAVKGKKALLVDCDLRHGSASQFVGMPHHGLSNYLTGATDRWQDLVVEAKEAPGLFVMPIGHRPPNPAELLDNGRIGQFIKEASPMYDYIILDCPPIDIVVDTQLLEKYADQTIFVVRAGLLEKAAVAEIDEMYRNHRFRRMAILLNGTEGANSRAATYGSSYYTNDF